MGNVKLYLVQHGLNNAAEMDPQKNLSEEGRKDVEKMAVFLKNAAVFVEDIYHSGKARSRQTAEILAAAVQLNKKVKKRDALEPMDPVDDLKKEITGRESDLMVVGHMPYLSKLASMLLTGLEQSDVMEFQQGGVACLERFTEKWQVKWMVIPDLL